MIKRTTLLVLFCFLVACAGNVRERAWRAAVVIEDVTNKTAPAWERYVDAKIQECGDKLDPREASQDEARKCLGPAAQADKVRKATEALHRGQLALYVILTGDYENDRVRAALRDLLARFNDLLEPWTNAGVVPDLQEQD